MRTRKTPEAAKAARDIEFANSKRRKSLGAMFTPAGKPPKKDRAKSMGISKSQAGTYMRQLEEMMAEGEYENFKPRHWVAFFCWIHEAVYDVSCVDEIRPQWTPAAGRASAMLKEEFEGDTSEFFAFMQWLAKDEERVEIWRRSNRKPGRRLGWRDFFLNKRKLSDYRVAMARTQGIQ